MGLTPPPTEYAKSGDVHVAYQVTGSGEVDMVLAPGTVSHLGLDWERPERVAWIERLSSFCRLIRFDKRGTGLSDRPLTVATLEERTDDIRAVMDAADSERAVLLGSRKVRPWPASSPQRTQTGRARCSSGERWPGGSRPRTIPGA